ncbi:hypothetical protein Tco_1517522 [Tanacetum coccineum]
MILDEEQLAFLVDPGIDEALVAQQTIPKNSAFQTEDLDAYYSDCDDISSAKVVLMENLSRCDSNVLSKIPYPDSSPNDMINHNDTNSSAPNDLLVLSLVEQITDHVAHLDKENQTNKMANQSLTAELKRYKERVAIFEQRQNVDLNKNEKLIDSQMDDLIRNRNANLAAFQQEIDTLKETLSNNVKEKESLSKTLTVFKTKSKENESKYIDKEIVLEKQNKELENIVCMMYRSTQAMLTKPQVFYDDTHKQAFELFSEQAFWLKHSSFSETPVTSHTPVRIEAPSELPKEDTAYLCLHFTKDHEDIDQDSAHMVVASKVPMLKPGEYEVWRMRIEQYIQMIDYAPWEVIENGATLPKTKIVEGVMTKMPITTAEEKA